MSSEVVHDDPFRGYLDELKKLDKIWEVPTKVKRFIPAAIFISFVMAISARSDWMLVPGFLIPVVSLILTGHSARMNNRYHRLNMKYLPKMMPNIWSNKLGDRPAPYNRHKVVYKPGEVEYFCDLREYAESRGEKGWSALLEGKGSFDEVVRWAYSRPR